MKKILSILVIILLIAGVIGGVYLVQKQQKIKSKAVNTGTRIEAIGPNIIDGKAISPNIRLKLTFVPPAAASSLPTPASSGESVEYSLAAGWNFIGIPVQVSITPSQLLEKTQNKCDSIISFNSQTIQAEAYFSDPAKAALNSLTQVTSGKGYQVKCSGPITLTLSGPATTALPALVSGNVQYISLPKGKTITAEEFLTTSSNSSLNCTQVDRYENGVWTPHIKGSTANNFPMTDKEGYIVKCQAVSTLAPITAPTTGIGISQNIGVGGSVKGIATTVLAEGSIFPTHFRISNDRSTLDSSPEQVFDQNDKEIDWTLTSGNGEKIIYAQFKVNGTWSQVYQTTIVLDTPATHTPAVEAASCLSLQDKIRRASGKSCADSGYDKLADINKNQLVNSEDSILLKAHLSDEAWCNQKLSDTTDPCTQRAPGDTNQDGKIDLTDLSYLLSKMGAKSDFKGADLDGNGVVDDADLDLLRSILVRAGLLSEQIAPRPRPGS